MRGYVVAAADLVACRAALEGLWARNFGDGRSDRCEAYLSNPDGPGSAWGLLAADGEMVGASGLLTREFKVGGGAALVGQTVNLAVDPTHRSAGPALQLQRAAAARGGLLLGVTEKAEAVQKRVGYREVGRVTRWTKLLRTGCKLRPLLGVGAALAGPMLDAALWLLSRGTFAGLPPGWRDEGPDSFDGRFDALWAEAAGLKFAASRTAGRLAWRFRRDAPYRILAVASGQALMGYAVVRVEDGAAHVMDALARDGAAYDALLGSLLRRLWAERPAPRSVTVCHFGGSALPLWLRRHGFLARPDARKVLLLAGHDAPAGLFDPAGWHLTGMDIDL